MKRGYGPSLWQKRDGSSVLFDGKSFCGEVGLGELLLYRCFFVDKAEFYLIGRSPKFSEELDEIIENPFYIFPTAFLIGFERFFDFSFFENRRVILTSFDVVPFFQRASEIRVLPPNFFLKKRRLLKESFEKMILDERFLIKEEKVEDDDGI